MEPSSRTPEGIPRRCDLCGHEIKIEPSGGTGDAPCPRCGYLLWFGSHGLPGKDRREFERTKQQIRSMVGEIAELAKSGLAWRSYCQEFLPLVVSCLAAHGGAIWTLGLDGRLSLQHQINLQQTGLQQNEAAHAAHSRILQQVLTEGEPLFVPARSRLEDPQAANPTDFLLVFGRLEAEGKVVGIVEIFQRPDSDPAAQKGYVRFLRQVRTRDSASSGSRFASVVRSVFLSGSDANLPHRAAMSLPAEDDQDQSLARRTKQVLCGDPWFPLVSAIRDGTCNGVLYKLARLCRS
jgi:hypothetical protein